MVLEKKNIKGKDNLIRAIRSAQVYQFIPPELFKDKDLVDCINERNKHAPRFDFDRNEYLKITGKVVLDVGCNIGYFGWSNAKRIKSYTGIDSDSSCIKAARMIKKELEFNNLRFMNVSLVDFLKTVKGHYDVCLFFSVYHHLLYQIGVLKARKVLDRISELCDELYFDMGQKNEPSNRFRDKWHRLLPDEDPESYIVSEVLNTTSFKHSEVIGETKVAKSKRLLFRFTK